MVTDAKLIFFVSYCFHFIVSAGIIVVNYVRFNRRQIIMEQKEGKNTDDKQINSFMRFNSHT